MDLLKGDCDRCQSAHSVEHGVCQVCLAEQPTRAVRLGTLMASGTLRRKVDRDKELVSTR